MYKFRERIYLQKEAVSRPPVDVPSKCPEREYNKEEE